MTFLTRKYITGEYRRVSFKTKGYHVKLDVIMSLKQPVTSGSLFLETSDARSAPQKHAATHVRTKARLNAWTGWTTPCQCEKELDAHHDLGRRCPDFACCTWRESCWTAVRPSPSQHFCIDLGVAEKFGLIEPPQERKESVMGPQGVNGYKLGPNLPFNLPSVTNDNQTPHTCSSNRSVMNWNGGNYAGTQPTDVTRGWRIKLFIIIYLFY